jgi:LacI family transcriptional regulator
MSECRTWSVVLETGDRVPLWLPKWKGNGILCRSWNQDIADLVDSTGMPAVEVRASKAKHQIPFVGVDNYAVGETIAAYFLDRGFRNFACYALDVESFVENRATSFVDTLQNRGHHCHTFYQKSRGEDLNGRTLRQDALCDWLKSLPKPCGLMACLDEYGFTVLEACRRTGIPVPEDIAVVGVGDDDSVCELATPPLSSIRLAGVKVGYEAARMLEQLMAGEQPPETQVLIRPIGITERTSSDIISVEDKVISKALQIIRERPLERLDIDALASLAGVSRRTLERRMRDVIGRSPNEEIARVKLNVAREFLSDTSLSVSEIAYRIGFSHPQYLTELFRKSFGLTPTQYRDQIGVQNDA